MSTTTTVTTVSVIDIINDLNHAYTELAYYNEALANQLAVIYSTTNMDEVTATERMIKMHSENFQTSMCQLFEFSYVAVPTPRKNQYGTCLFKAVAI